MYSSDDRANIGMYMYMYHFGSSRRDFPAHPYPSAERGVRMRASGKSGRGGPSGTGVLLCGLEGASPNMPDQGIGGRPQRGRLRPGRPDHIVSRWARHRPAVSLVYGKIPANVDSGVRGSDPPWTLIQTGRDLVRTLALRPGLSGTPVLRGANRKEAAMLSIHTCPPVTLRPANVRLGAMLDRAM